MHKLCTNCAQLAYSRLLFSLRPATRLGDFAALIRFLTENAELFPINALVSTNGEVPPGVSQSGRTRFGAQSDHSVFGVPFAGTSWSRLK